MEVYSEKTVKHLKNLLAFAKGAQLKELPGEHALAFADAFYYCLKLIDEVEQDVEQRKKLDDLANNED